MLIVIFLPGGLMEGFNRLRNWIGKRFGGGEGGGGVVDAAPVAVGRAS